MARSRFVIFSLLALGAILACAPPAAAGQYTVYSCKTPSGGVAPTDGWTLLDNLGDSGRSGDDCALGASLYASIASTATDYGGLKYGWTLSAPANTLLSQASVWKWGRTDRLRSQSSNAGPAAWLSLGSSDYANAAWSCSSQANCFQNGFVVDGVRSENLWSGAFPPGTGRQMALMVGCAGSGQCVQRTDAEYMAKVAMQAATLKLTDNPAPAVTVPPQGPLLGTGDHRGAESLTFTATDQGSGLYRTFVDVRAPGAEWQTSASIVDGNGGHCAQLDETPSDDYEFGFLVPCKLNAGVTASFDTSKRHDGAYELRVRIEDAAGNATVAVPARPFTIHNAPTVEPGSVSVSGAARTGSVLTADSGRWTGDNHYTYAWLRCTDASVDSCATIAGATQLSYTPVTADLGRKLQFEMTASNPEGTVTESSSAVGPVTTAAGTIPQCADGVDNDADSLVDELDPQCKDRADNLEAPDPPAPTPTPTPSATATASPGGSTAIPSGPSPTPVRTSTPAAGAISESSSGHGSPPVAGASPALMISGGSRRTLGFRRRATVTVSLVDDRGRPITGVPLRVLERTNVAGADFKDHGLELTTDADGVAALPVSAGPSRTLRVTYRAGVGDGAPDAAADVLVLVRSRTTLRKSRSFLRNGEALRFSGRLLSTPVPSSGVGIDIQARVGHHWQTFKTLKTDGEGRWRSHYRFRSTSGLQTYRFRARVRGDSAFPYLPSTSKRVSVRVQGQ